MIYYTTRGVRLLNSTLISAKILTENVLYCTSKIGLNM